METKAPRKGKVLLLLFSVIGVFFVIEMLIGFYRSEKAREPAAINRKEIFDFSHLKDVDLHQAVAMQLLKDPVVVKDQGVYKVGLGHSLTRDLQGERKSLCEVYDLVTLRFEAEGMAVDGQRPSLEITAPCHTSNSMARLEPVLIPYEELSQAKPTDGEFSFGSANDQVFRTENLPSSWPADWVLTEVKLSNKSQPGLQIHLDRREVYKYSAHPVILNW